ncbi:unnamed protein product [Lampetra fluviatilis]
MRNELCAKTRKRQEGEKGPGGGKSPPGHTAGWTLWPARFPEQQVAREMRHSAISPTQSAGWTSSNGKCTGVAARKIEATGIFCAVVVRDFS